MERVVKLLRPGHVLSSVLMICVVQNKNGSIAADQIRVVDKTRLGSKIDNLSVTEIKELKQILQQMLVD